jgi:hypothetical protein
MKSHPPRIGHPGRLLAVLTHGTSVSLAEMWGRHLGQFHRNGRANWKAPAMFSIHAISQVCGRAYRRIGCFGVVHLATTRHAPPAFRPASAEQSSDDLQGKMQGGIPAFSHFARRHYEKRRFCVRMKLA